MNLRQGLSAILTLITLLAALTTLACGSQDQPTDPGPTATATTAQAEATQQPTLQSIHSTVTRDTSQRPTTPESQNRTPQGTAITTQAPTTTTEPPPAQATSPTAYRDQVAHCTAEWLEILAQDRGLVGPWFEMHPRSLTSMLRKQDLQFDVAYVTALNDHFEASRPDCVAAGWDPEFSHEPECQGVTFRENDITSGGSSGSTKAPAIEGESATSSGSPPGSRLTWC